MPISNEDKKNIDDRLTAMKRRIEFENKRTPPLPDYVTKYTNPLLKALQKYPYNYNEIKSIIAKLEDNRIKLKLSWLLKNNPTLETLKAIGYGQGTIPELTGLLEKLDAKVSESLSPQSADEIKVLSDIDIDAKKQDENKSVFDDETTALDTKTNHEEEALRLAEQLVTMKGHLNTKKSSENAAVSNILDVKFMSILPDVINGVDIMNATKMIGELTEKLGDLKKDIAGADPSEDKKAEIAAFNMVADELRQLGLVDLEDPILKPLSVAAPAPSLSGIQVEEFEEFKVKADDASANDDQNELEAKELHGQGANLNVPTVDHNLAKQDEARLIIDANGPPASPKMSDIPGHIPTKTFTEFQNSKQWVTLVGQHAQDTAFVTNKDAGLNPNDDQHGKIVISITPATPPEKAVELATAIVGAKEAHLNAPTYHITATSETAARALAQACKNSRPPITLTSIIIGDQIYNKQEDLKKLTEGTALGPAFHAAAEGLKPPPPPVGVNPSGQPYTPAHNQQASVSRRGSIFTPDPKADAESKQDPKKGPPQPD